MHSISTMGPCAAAGFFASSFQWSQIVVCFGWSIMTCLLGMLGVSWSWFWHLVSMPSKRCCSSNWSTIHMCILSLFTPSSCESSSLSGSPIMDPPVWLWGVGPHPQVLLNTDTAAPLSRNKGLILALNPPRPTPPKTLSPPALAPPPPSLFKVLSEAQRGWLTIAESRSYEHEPSVCIALQEFSTIWHAWLTMFNFMVSGFEFGIFYDCHNPEAAILLVVLYMFVVAVIFLNLLVGIMTDSWSKVRSFETSTIQTASVDADTTLNHGHPMSLPPRQERAQS